MGKGGGGGGRSEGRNQSSSSESRSKNGSHDDISTSYEENKNAAIKEYADLLNVSTEKAEQMLKSINDFTGQKYSEFRDLEFKNKTNSEVAAINDFLEKAPIFKGDIYRGANFKNEKDANKFIENLAKGTKLGAMSSFTSDVKTGFGFATGDAGERKGNYGVLIKVVNNKSGASIEKISKYGTEEKEVLVGKNTSYKLISSKTNPKYPGLKIVTLEEN